MKKQENAVAGKFWNYTAKSDVGKYAIKDDIGSAADTDAYKSKRGNFLFSAKAAA